MSLLHESFPRIKHQIFSYWSSSVEKCQWRHEKYYMGCLAMVVLFATVKELKTLGHKQHNCRCDGLARPGIKMKHSVSSIALCIEGGCLPEGLNIEEQHNELIFVNKLCSKCKNVITRLMLLCTKWKSNNMIITAALPPYFTCV